MGQISCEAPLECVDPTSMGPYMHDRLSRIMAWLATPGPQNLQHKVWYRHRSFACASHTASTTHSKTCTAHSHVVLRSTVLLGLQVTALAWLPVPSILLSRPCPLHYRLHLANSASLARFPPASARGGRPWHSDSETCQEDHHVRLVGLGPPCRSEQAHYDSWPGEPAEKSVPASLSLQLLWYALFGSLRQLAWGAR